MSFQTINQVYQNLTSLQQLNTILTNNLQFQMPFQIILKKTQEVLKNGQKTEFIQQNVLQVTQEKTTEKLEFKNILIQSNIEQTEPIMLKKLIIKIGTEVDLNKEFEQLILNQQPNQKISLELHIQNFMDSEQTLRIVLGFILSSLQQSEWQEKKNSFLNAIQENKFSKIYDSLDYKYVTIDYNTRSVNYNQLNKSKALIMGFSPQYLQAVQHLQQFYGKENWKIYPKQLLQNPVQIQKDNIQEYYPWRNMIISVKADGERVIVVANQKSIEIISDIKIQQFEVQANNLEGEVILEAEIVKNRIYCYDIHSYWGLKVFKQSYYSQRLEYLEKVISQLKDVLVDGRQFFLKKYIFVQNTLSDIQLKELFTDIQNKDQYLQEINDGLIINSNDIYTKQKIFKWKPSNKLTIDFYVEKNQQFSTKNYIAYTLFTSINRQHSQYQKFAIHIQTQLFQQEGMVLIPFQPTICPNKCFIYFNPIENDQKVQLHGKVCEFGFEIIQCQWILHRVRDDKDPLKGQFGNYFTVAEQTFFNIINFIKLEDLYYGDAKKNAYFKIQRPESYDKMTNHINKIKGFILREFIQKHTVLLDLGCGKGQDLLKYTSIGLKQIIMVDKDLDALQELASRKNALKDKFLPLIFSYKLDLTQKNDSDYLLDIVKEIKLNAVVCNLAIHYMLDNIDSIIQLFEQIQQNGHVILSFMDGQLIFNKLLKNKIEIFDYDQNNNQYQKYLITKLYQGDNFEKTGQYIEVKLPFSDTPVKEMLVNSQFLIQKMQASGFQIIANFNCDMTGNYQKLEHQNSIIQHLFQNLNSLSQADRDYVSLYKILVMKRQ